MVSAAYAPQTFISGSHILGVTLCCERTKECQKQIGPPRARIHVTTYQERTS